MKFSYWKVRTAFHVFTVIVHCKTKCILLQGGDVQHYDKRARITFHFDQHRTTTFENLPSKAGVKLLKKLPVHMKNKIV